MIVFSLNLFMKIMLGVEQRPPKSQERKSSMLRLFTNTSIRSGFKQASESLLTGQKALGATRLLNVHEYVRRFLTIQIYDILPFHADIHGYYAIT